MDIVEEKFILPPQFSSSARHGSSMGTESGMSSSVEIGHENLSWSEYSFSKEDQAERLGLLKSGVLDASITPFVLHFVFGINSNVPVINLTREGQKKALFASSLAACKLNIDLMKFEILHGHCNTVTTISTDQGGKYLVTADAGPNNSIIVWDGDTLTPILTIFDPFPEVGTAVASISHNAKYLIAISNGQTAEVKFWLWTYGIDEPDDRFMAKHWYGSPLKVNFNPNIPEHIMIGFDNQILFLYWDIKTQRLQTTAEPKYRYRRMITDCTYVDKCHECVASTMNGCVLVYGCTLYARPYEEAELDNHKIYVKTIKVSNSIIGSIMSMDGIIVTGDENGHINFYDKKMKLLYWLHDFKLGPIISLSFNLEPRNIKVVDAMNDDDFDDTLFAPTETVTVIGEYEDRVDEYEIVFKQNLPSDASPAQEPFLMRDFVLVTENGVIYYVDVIDNDVTPLNSSAESTVAAIECHSIKELLLIAYTSNRLRLENYLTHQKIADYVLPQRKDGESDEMVQVSYIKYSHNSMHLACGRTNGELWILDSILLRAKVATPFRITKNGIVKIVFSMCNKYMAYYDCHNTTCLLKFIPELDRWVFAGKVRAHYKTVNDILFSSYIPSRLFTISDDRFLVEYDINNSTATELIILNRERVEQSATPKNFTYYPLPVNNDERYFIVMDDQYKYKLINDVTSMCRSVTLGPAYGCYKNKPIKNMQILEENDNKYLIFITDRHLGLQKLPLDCSPYTYISTIAHPDNIKNFRISLDGRYVFTFGENDRCVLMWTVNTDAVEILNRIGGQEMEPYYCLLEGGANGWLFKEMQDLFYYMQILHQGENTMMPRVVSDYIPITELPDLMRACGYYPSEFEVENLIVDIKYREQDGSSKLKDEVTFLEFVKLYLNHRPAHGISFNKLEQDFNTLMYSVDEPNANFIDRDEFVRSICIKGEPFSEVNLQRCLSILMHTDQYDEDDDDQSAERESFGFLPTEITYDIFIEDILGIDMEKRAMSLQ